MQNIINFIIISIIITSFVSSVVWAAKYTGNDDSYKKDDFVQCLEKTNNDLDWCWDTIIK